MTMKDRMMKEWNEMKWIVGITFCFIGYCIKLAYVG